MRRSIFAATVSVMALLAVAGAATAQDAAPLRVGDRINGELAAGDGRVDDQMQGQFLYDTYTVQARQGQRLEFVMRSDDFDSYLQLFEEGSDEPVASDDDGLGEGLHSRLRYSPGDGVYTLRARTLGGLEGGDYTLTLSDRGPAPRPPRPGSIRMGATINGEISTRDPVETDAAYEYSYDAFAFRARAGERLAFSLKSEDFDPILRVGRYERDRGFVELATNDDSGGTLDSYLIFAAPESGEYVVRAAPLSQDGEGDYRLELTEAPPPPVLRDLAFGETVEGRLDADDGTNVSGNRADGYRFSGRSGQRVVIEAASDAFDTVVELYAGDENSRYLFASDDDGAGEGTNSRLAATLSEDGTYEVQVRSFSAEGTGAYSLTLSEAPPEPEPVALAYGETIQGAVVEADPRDNEGRGFDAYRLSGEAGSRIQAIMRSGDFDTYLQIGSADGEFYALGSDDDGLGEGTDSRLNFILPTTGDYILRASPLYAEADGLYSLELIDRGPQPLPGSILVGATARGTLTEADAISDEGVFYDAYRVTVKAGDKLRLTMVSNEFDAYIDVGRDDEAGTFTSVVSDDDSLSDTHAKIDWSVEEDGEYVIRARSFSASETGGYALTVEPKT